jgi:tryptophan-rich sensory protein
MKKNDWLKLVGAIVVSQCAGLIGSLFTFSAIPNWYATIVKPSFNPPSWIFGPVWTTLYVLMGISAFLIWKKLDHKILPNLNGKKIKIALIIFGVQLFLNALWSIIFFGLHQPGFAFVEMILLWLAIILTMISFAKISKPAMYLLIPYILWVSFAGFLNFTLWQLNKNTIVPPMIACTMEAKLCPDGTAVGRSGPNCEFAPCSGEIDLAKELADCLPKSDLASKEKCDSLLAEITDFTSCAKAGFPIMESYPEQCRTADGRNFVRQIDQ